MATTASPYSAIELAETSVPLRDKGDEDTLFLLHFEGLQATLEEQGRSRVVALFFSMLSCVVSMPFYAGFLPLIFWSGYSRLARQMTLLIAFCDYLGNSTKDLVSAPRPSSPPIRRLEATKDEKEHAME